MDDGVVGAVHPDQPVEVVVDEPREWMRHQAERRRRGHHALRDMAALDEGHAVAALPVLPPAAAERGDEHHHGRRLPDPPGVAGVRGHVLERAVVSDQLQDSAPRMDVVHARREPFDVPGQYEQVVRAEPARRRRGP